MIEMLARRTAALLLVLLAAVVPVVAAARLSAWENELAGRKSVEPLGIADVAVIGTLLWGIILVGLWWHWRRTTMWPVWSRWASATGLFAAFFECVQLAGDRGRPVALAVWLGLAVLCWALGEAVRLVLTRPVTPRLIASKLEIPFPLRGLKARLCVRADRLVLDSLASRRKRSRDVAAVPWTTLRSIELVEVDQEMTCSVFVFSATKVGNVRRFDVPPGPALHVIGTARELLVPVTEQLGRVVVEAVRQRSAGVELDESPLTEEDWCRQSGVPRYDTTIYSEQLRRNEKVANYATDKRPYVLGVIGTFLLMPLVMLCGTALSVITGSAYLQKQFKVFDGVIDPIWVATLGVGSIVFLYLLNGFVIQGFVSSMKFQDYIEAFPEAPAPPPKTGTVPGSGKKRKKR
ncbi:hypothetical protein [Lentzea sp. NBRC 102530]|uniref:hypothetical protein n=1 Tax=Lentzea sp. NBRC 102530 TaxID=3032201 RepID=UPI0024A6044A|nr:hypothetical protein [Lentzea sp. NBRC 102530]GLY52120.1 hypothetical protein Lesp01_57760 [Lentzea sp. NBRC 102530]